MSNIQIDESTTSGEVIVTPGVVSELATTTLESAGEMTNSSTYAQENVEYLSRFLQRRSFLRMYTLNSTDTPGVAIQRWDPMRVFLTLTPIRNKTDNFQGIRGTFRLTVVSSFPAGAYGLYALCINMLGGTSLDVNAQLVNRHLPVEQALHVPHILIRVANATDSTIDVPFVYDRDHIAMNFSTYGGVFEAVFFCLQPVTSSVADSTLQGTVTVYGEFLNDVELVNAIQQSGKAQKSWGTSIKETASSLSTIAGSLSTISPLAVPVAKGAAAVESALDYFGFTRTTFQKTPEPFIPRLFSNVANVDAPDTSEVAAYMVGNSISYDPSIGGQGSHDEGNIDYITSHWTEVTSFSWTSAQVIDTDIGELYVSPFFTKSCSAWDSPITLTSAGYVGLPFAWWRADMEYRVIIPVSVFHRGVLQILWAPNESLDNTNLTNQVNNIIYSVSATNDLCFSVNYSQLRPLSACVIHSADFPGNQNERWRNGKIVFRVVNPLTAPVDTTSTTVRVYARARNLQLAVPKTVDKFVNEENEDSYYSFPFTWQVQGTLGDGGVGEVFIPLNPKTTSGYPMSEIHSGEKIESVRALMQKLDPLFSSVNHQDGTYGYNYTQPGYQLATRTYIFPHVPTPRSNYAVYNANGVTLSVDNADYSQFTHAAWYGALFVGIASSTRYKVINSPDYPKMIRASCCSVNAAIFSDGDFNGSQLNAGLVSPDTVMKPSEGYEFTIPYYGPYKFQTLATREDIESDGILISDSRVARYDVMTTHVLGLPEDTDSKGVMIYRGCGPDLRLVCYRFPPVILRGNFPGFNYLPYPH